MERNFFILSHLKCSSLEKQKCNKDIARKETQATGANTAIVGVAGVLKCGQDNETSSFGEIPLYENRIQLFSSNIGWFGVVGNVPTIDSITVLINEKIQ